ncbi:MAG: hypothetical protein RL131_330 [Bacteroidota bacterium]|jgi:hypothetical protein
MKRFFALLLVSFFSSISFAQVDMATLIEKQFAHAAAQYKILEKNVPDSMMPKTFNKTTGKVEVSNTKWWCSGFFPASLLYIYEHTGDQDVLRIAKSDWLFRKRKSITPVTTI